MHSSVHFTHSTAVTVLNLCKNDDALNLNLKTWPRDIFHKNNSQQAEEKIDKQELEYAKSSRQQHFKIPGFPRNRAVRNGYKPSPIKELLK